MGNTDCVTVESDACQWSPEISMYKLIKLTSLNSFFFLKSARSLVSYSLKLPLSSSYFFTKRTVFYNMSDNSKILIFCGSVLATSF